MTLDSERERHLQRQFGGQQYGQTLDVTSNPGATNAIATIAKDVVRWQGGEDADDAPWRVYLAPWQPKANIDTTLVGPPAAGAYATPTPWNTPPRNFDCFSDGQLYARVNFGTGGVKHTAYVDWPMRGLLFQVSCSYIQIDGVGTIGQTGTADRLPILGATLAPEPGGGDAGNPATYTYPLQNTGVGAVNVVFFQIPPFARAFTPIIRRDSAPTSLLVQQFGGGASGPWQSWNWNTAIGADFPDDRSVPLSGQGDGLLKFTGSDAMSTLLAGCMFWLDL